MRPKLHRAARFRVLVQFALLAGLVALFVGASFIPGTPGTLVQAALVPCFGIVALMGVVRAVMRPYMRRFFVGY